MRTYGISVSISGVDPDTSFIEFIEFGCSDATISFCNQIMRLDFDREAERFSDALMTVAVDLSRLCDILIQRGQTHLRIEQMWWD